MNTYYKGSLGHITTGDFRGPPGLKSTRKEERPPFVENRFSIVFYVFRLQALNAV